MKLTAGKKVEAITARIYQGERLASIHLVFATYTLPVVMITCLIKDNNPTRSAFQVSAKINSRTIGDQCEAE